MCEEEPEGWRSKGCIRQHSVSQGKESDFSVQWEPKLRFESHFQRITQIAVWEMNSSQAREGMKTPVTGITKEHVILKQRKNSSAQSHETET